MTEESPDGPMANSQLSELHNMRVLLEEARGLSRNLAYHRRARLESTIGEALDGVDRQVRVCGPPRARGLSSQPTTHQQVHHEHSRDGHSRAQHCHHHKRHSAYPFRW